jgi:hypothetical protein
MNFKDGLAFICALSLLPFAIVSWFFRAREHFAFIQLSKANEIVCQCGNPIPLVGLWRCSCSFTYRGHLLQICPLCGRRPRICRCYACGLTMRLPEALSDQTD